MKKYSNFLDLSDITFNQVPYCHFHASPVYFNQATEKIYSWYSTDAPWQLVETDFYEQYEFSLSKIKLPNNLDFLTKPASLRLIRQKMEKIFEVSLAEKVEVTAHKLIKGQSIRLHNDYIDSEETHRLIIHVNPGWTDKHGGIFIICHSARPEDICKLIRPLDNSAVGFAISEDSCHAVSKVHGPDRYSLVYSFRGEPTAHECFSNNQSLS